MQFASTGVLCFGFICFNVQAAAPTNLILNGDFESGTFANWTVISVPSGPWAINDGVFDPIGPAAPLPPISGRYDAVTNQGGPGFRALRQIVAIPTNVLSAKLVWSDRLRNFAENYVDPSQEFRVTIRNSAGTVVLQEVFSTTPGDQLQQIGPNLRSGDLTALFQAHAGENVIVSFEEQDILNVFNVTLDDIALLVSQVPTIQDECKYDGWQTFVNVNTGQQVFKNQGACVGFVASKGANWQPYQ